MTEAEWTAVGPCFRYRRTNAEHILVRPMAQVSAANTAWIQTWTYTDPYINYYYSNYNTNIK